MIVIDTNIVIGYMQNDVLLGTWLEARSERGERFVLSSVSVVELLGFAKITESEFSAIEHWIRRTSVVSLDHSLAVIAARLRREFRLTTADSIIAATAVYLEVPLATRDKDLAKIREIEIIRP